jgi:tetratricopeptide (TPR) repeat protein
LVTNHQGLCLSAATALPARQRIRGVLGKLLGRFWPAQGNGIWLLPNGDSAEQCGERQTDLLLVWPEDNTSPLEECRLRTCWPQCQRLQALGPQVWLLWGVGQPTGGYHLPPPPASESCLQQARQRLAATCQAADRPGKTTALTDLGIALFNQGEVSQALTHLEKALTLARDLADPARENDVLGNLALALLAARQPDRAQRYLEQERAYRRSVGDGWGEKLALERLGTVQASRGNLPAALALLHEALVLARSLGDRQHEADLLWHLAVRQADHRDRPGAVVHAQAAVDLWQKQGVPQARIYAEHLQKYQQAETGAALAATSAWSPNGLVTSVTTSSPMSAPAPTPSSPSLLRMAISAAKALTQFVGSGLQTVSATVRQERLRICATCPHHTALRCRICGCFTNLKTRLPHEDCPLGQWPVLQPHQPAMGSLSPQTIPEVPRPL